MGCPTKIQCIKRKTSEQWYVNFPSAIAQAMEFDQSEIVEWIVEDKSQLVLRRQTPPPSALKKNQPPASSGNSKSSGAKPRKTASKSASGSGRGRSG